MIDTKELRRGNLIFASEDENGNPEPCKVFEIYEDGIKWGMPNDDRGGNSTCYKYLDPIPLTPEWLEKAGEKYSGEDKNWEYEIRVGALKWYFRWNTEWYSELGGIYMGSRVQYLHQGQNIYYDFTGQELTIKQ